MKNKRRLIDLIQKNFYLFSIIPSIAFSSNIHLCRHYHFYIDRQMNWPPEIASISNHGNMVGKKISHNEFETQCLNPSLENHGNVDVYFYSYYKGIIHGSCNISFHYNSYQINPSVAFVSCSNLIFNGMSYRSDEPDNRYLYFSNINN